MNLVKTISLDDEAYRLLKAHKLGPGDSFSKVVKRHFGHPRQEGLEASFGAWKDAPADFARRLREESRRNFDRE